MNYHVLKLFYYVAITGSVTKASERLHISQPAISAQIRKFERENNIVLLEVIGKRMVLTPIGRKLIEPLEKLFAMGEQVQQIIEDYHKFPAGHIRIAGNYLATSILIPRWASLYKQSFPEVKIQISTANSHEVMEQLNNFEADVAIYSDMAFPSHHTGVFEHRELYKDEYVFVVSSNHSLAKQEVSFEEVMAEAFIMREEGSAARERIVQLCEERKVQHPKIELQFNGVNEVIQAVIAGYGISFVSALLAKPYLDQGMLAKVEVENVVSKHSIWMSHRKKELQESYIQSFIKLVMKRLKEEDNLYSIPTHTP
ncbi:LysR family transcriptional regulator [Paenibacillus sp. B2(2019)]|uniref:LysR family transcriptional regulator n=1 Tax=Paenibacillus sp. B2(2019) TaxID=2607754 RepID=UPI0011F24EBB|nr:LysR family transcriptional regulator [Paenibacillus sp. B2(2019)]KAA1181850.1 LysR family transcriptional regulator [Paenibacillus sp. B2(2019)]